MRTGTGKYYEVYCSRCDRKATANDGKDALTGWEWRKDTGDLCPECFAEYKRVLERFMSKKTARAALLVTAKQDGNGSDGMRFYGIYRCKQCGATINAENEFGGMFKDGLAWSFIRDDPIISISPYKAPDRAISHRCNDSTYGLCELIGWRREEE